MVKHSMASLLPRYNASTYGRVNTLTISICLQAGKVHSIQENNFDNAKKVASWKTKVKSAWSGVTLKRLDEPCKRHQFWRYITF